MKPLIILFILTAYALAQTPKPLPPGFMEKEGALAQTPQALKASPLKVAVPKDRLITAAHYLQVAEVYAKTGAKPNVSENRAALEPKTEEELRAEVLRLLPAFQTANVSKERRPEVTALYVGAVKKLTLNQNADHAGIVHWIAGNPKEFAPTIRQFGKIGTDALK